MTDDSEKFSKRLKEVAQLLFDGKSRKMIADILHISKHTVKTLVQRLYDKAQAHSLGEFLKYMRIHPDEFAM